MAMKKILLIFALLLLPLSAQAQSSGAACSPNGASAWTSGTPLICTSGTWAIDTARVGSSSATCNGTIQGTMRMNSTTMEYCNGTAWTSVVPTGGGAYSASVSTFDASGTWNKPSTGTVALIECWGGGGSGAKSSGCGGGGGGGYNFRWVPLSSMGSTETVTIGAGGTAVTTNVVGVAGGNSSVGSLLTAYGGARGNTSTSAPGGGGGGQNSAGSGADPGRPWINIGGVADGCGGALVSCQHGSAGQYWSYAINIDGFGGTVTGMDCGGSNAIYHGGGGAGKGPTSYTSVAGSSLFGGGGGGSCGSGATGAGTSQYGGAGGAGGTTGNGTAGTQPGGGGGGTNTGTSSGAGGAGRCRVTTF
jgi:hypothetical protein